MGIRRTDFKLGYLDIRRYQAAISYVELKSDI